MAVISSQLNKRNSKLFTRQKYANLSFVFALVLSLIFMVGDGYLHCCTEIRQFFSCLVSPLQYAVDYPIRMVNWGQSLVSSKKELVSENMQLRYQQTLLETQLQKLLAVTHENSQLKELLMTSSNTNTLTMAAQILAVETSLSRQLLVLNKGKRDGVFAGQPVLDAKGVVGQIIDAGAMTSTVLLISDTKSAVPVQNNRTGELAILIGTNKTDQLSLINLPKTSSVQEGDLLITSGLGRCYPQGYPVGYVNEIKNIPGDDFIQVRVTPVALLNHNRLLLLVWPEKEHAALSTEISERLNAQGGHTA